MFRSILVPVDVAQTSSWRYALPQAIELATAAQGTVVAMTVVRDIKAILEGVYLQGQLDRMIGDARAKLSEIIAQQTSGPVTLAQVVRTGSIAHEILAVAREQACDLILMASHRPEMRDYFIGPVAAHVAQRAECSVLVHRQFDELTPTMIVS